MKKIVVINGPNLNLLGKRERDIYGNNSLKTINDGMAKEAKRLDMQCEFFQSNIEGELVSAIQNAATADGIILNAAAYTHYSVAIRDAISAISTPVVEVHFSNISAREEFRQTSMIAPVCCGSIAGFGAKGYYLALYSFANDNRA